MKNLVLTGTVIAATLLFSACDPQAQRQTKPARGATEVEVKPTPTPTPKPKVEKKKETKVEIEEPTAVVEPKPETKPVPPPSANPEYGKKAEGKAGFIESPYSPGKLIDVRGLPPGTEIECPYTRRPLLVP